MEVFVLLRASQGGQHVITMLARKQKQPPQVAVYKMKMARKNPQNHQFCEHPRGNSRRGDARKTRFTLEKRSKWEYNGV